jgi:hypothetical protein
MYIEQMKWQVGILSGTDRESCQFTKYKLNQYYDWHCDSWDKPYQKKEGDLTMVKLENYL